MTLTAFLLKEVIRTESKRIAIIHFQSTNAPWLQQLIQLESYFAGLTLTDNVEKYLTNTNDYMVLVSSYATVTGLEFAEVLLILEKDEYYLKHYISEAITRCTSHLSILVRHLWNKKIQSNTVKDLANHWQEINNIKIKKWEKCILKLLKLGFCYEKSCKKSNEESSSCQYLARSPEIHAFYAVHEHTKWYRGLSKKIDEKIVPILQLDDKTKEEEATAL